MEYHCSHNDKLAPSGVVAVVPSRYSLTLQKKKKGAKKKIKGGLAVKEKKTYNCTELYTLELDDPPS